MRTPNSALTLAEAVAPTSTSLATLAEQLRDGPLQDLIELQLKAAELANRLEDSPADRIEDIELLVRMSLSTMERFHAFTREFAAALRELTDVHRDAH
jgi:hypothetical protein